LQGFLFEIDEAEIVVHEADDPVIVTKSARLAPTSSSVRPSRAKTSRTWPSKSAASERPEESSIATCPASQIVRPPSVMTACE
jgi:hypothetical protein